MTMADGGSYEGQWLQDKMHGKGKLKAMGMTYIGEFKDDKLHG